MKYKKKHLLQLESKVVNFKNVTSENCEYDTYTCLTDQCNVTDYLVRVGK